jgi:glycosyltransferase involved in cell wall biosynthesis
VNSPFALEQSRDNDIRMAGFAQWSERVICNSATRVIVVSTPLARMLGDNGVDAARIDVMPNGVNVESFETGGPGDSGELRRALGIGVEPVIGFVGWFRKWHGLELLLEAYERAGLRGKAKLLLVGDGQAMADLQADVAVRRLQRDVIFTGPITHTQVPRYVDLIDIAVQPAANEYCCPMKIIEYMALGKAIVAPRQENIQELLQEEEAEFFDRGDAASLGCALQRLTEDRHRADELGRRARAAIHDRGYLWTSNAQRVIGAISKEAVPAGIVRRATLPIKRSV